MISFKSLQKPCYILMVLIVAVSTMSCTDFFSKSWAPWAARDPDKLIPKVNAGNVDELIAAAENNPDMSLAVLKKINEAKKGASKEDVAILQNAALEAAVNAVGLGSAVLNAAGEIINIDLSDVDAADDAKKIVLDAINSMKNLDATSQALCEILPQPNTQAFDDWASEAKPDDLAMAAVVLLAGEINKHSDNIDDYLESYYDADPNDITLPEELALALAIASIVSKQEDGLNETLKSMLQGLNLDKIKKP